jgi:lipoprotein NlpI
MRLPLALMIFIALCSVGTNATARADSAEELRKQAAAALDKGDKDKAVELATKAIDADPKDPRGYLFRGVVRDALRRHDEAVADFDKCIDLDPKLNEAYQRRGSTQFKRGKMAESLADFDKYLELKPDARPGHWQRGISLYYAGKFEDGKKQFAAYEKVDTNDVENAVWHFLCAARVDGVEKARANMLKIGKDPRVPMMQVYALFHGDLKPADVLAAAEDKDLKPAQKQLALFYAHLYLGLYDEANGDKKKALEHLELAADKYLTDGYMGDVARVHRDILRKDK